MEFKYKSQVALGSRLGSRSDFEVSYSEAILVDEMTIS